MAPAVAQWTSRELSAREAFNVDEAAASAEWDLDEAAASLVYDNDIQTAENTWNTAEQSAWNTYAGIEADADASWQNKATLAASTYESAIQNAETAWKETENAAWSSFLISSAEIGEAPFASSESNSSSLLSGSSSRSSTGSGSSSSSSRRTWGAWLFQAFGGVVEIGPVDAYNAAMGFVANGARTFANKNGKNEREVNALRHTHWQAMLTVLHGKESAVEVGNLHEHGQNDSPDSVTDEHNNVVGRKIGEKVLDEFGGAYNSSRYDDIKARIEELALEALKNGELIKSKTDPRIEKARWIQF